jgi:hypothetical protein
MGAHYTRHVEAEQNIIRAFSRDYGPCGQGMNRFCSWNGKRKGLIGKHLPTQNEKAMEINRADVAELVDARDFKSHLLAEIPREFCQTPRKITM